MAFGKGDTLAAFDERLAAAHMRGQWSSDEARDQGRGGRWQDDTWQPEPRGEAHLWKWAETERFLDDACNAIAESFTARRSLIFHAPGLARSTTHTMNTGIQCIKPGEIAWAHRHSISALRFVIDGHPDLCTVVDGAPCPMQRFDLVLTPNWRWHDHRNGGPGRALWFDALDGPLVSALNQTVFQNYGEKQQPVRNDRAPGRLHFPWAEIEPRVAGSAVDPCDGRVLPYSDPATGGPVTATIGAAVQALPPGFAGRPVRRSASAVYLAMRGAGRTMAGGRTLDWAERDVFVIPAWIRHAHANASADEDALLFRVTDEPALRALGLYREDAGADDTTGDH